MLPRNKIQILAALLMTLAARALLAQDTAKDLASFDGRVISRANGLPLAGVRVLLIATARNSRPHMAVSGPDGRVMIEGIAPGEYSISLSRQGYSTDSHASAAEKADRSRQRFAPGEAIQTVLYMVPNPIIAGRVVDSTGAPVENVRVSATGIRGWHTAETDDHGEFRMVLNRSGRYLVKALPDRHAPGEIRKDGSVPVVYGLTYFQSARSPESAAMVTVQSGEVSNIEIKLQPAPAAQVSGTVDGLPPGKTATLWLTGLEEIKAFTGPEGKFTFWRVPAGRYHLHATVNTEDKISLDSRDLPVDAGSDSIPGIHLPVTPPVTLKLKFRESDWKKYKDDISDVSVMVRGAKTNKQDSPDENGELSIEKLPPGNYHVLTDGLSGDLYIKALRPAEGQVTGRVLDVSFTASQEAVIELGADGAQISGVVRTQAGETTEADVVLLDDEDPDLVEVKTVTAKSDGYYLFHGVAPGKYRLLAIPPRGPESQLGIPGLYRGIIHSPEIRQLFTPLMEKIEVAAEEKARKDLKIE